MSYFNQYLEGKTLKQTVKAAAERLKKVNFDTIVCRGNSGLLFASALGVEMEKNILIVRKKTDNSHSVNIVEGEKSSVRKVLIVDDFISTGETVREIHKQVKLALPNGVKFSAIYLYSRDGAKERKFDMVKREYDGDKKIPHKSEFVKLIFGPDCEPTKNATAWG